MRSSLCGDDSASGALSETCVLYFLDLIRNTTWLVNEVYKLFGFTRHQWDKYEIENSMLSASKVLKLVPGRTSKDGILIVPTDESFYSLYKQLMKGESMLVAHDVYYSWTIHTFYLNPSYRWLGNVKDFKEPGRALVCLHLDQCNMPSDKNQLVYTYLYSFNIPAKNARGGLLLGCIYHRRTVTQRLWR